MGRAKKIVNKFNTIDRFIMRLLSQKLMHFYNPTFLAGSHAYQNEKGIKTAVDQARDYIEAGNEVVVEIDLKDFFDEIPLDRMMELLKEEIKDRAVIHLLEEYLYCSIANDGNVYKKEKGVVQGSSLSPVLSNLYLHNFDLYL